jgi:cysteine desulfurase
MAVYLDNAATTKIKKEVVESMLPYLIGQYYNPSSLYSSAAKIKEDIERAREIVGNFINATGDEIYFTSSGSESNCWAISGFCHYWNALKVRPVIITSTIEHKSVLECVRDMVADVYYVDVDKNGLIKLEILSKLLNNISLWGLPLLCSFQLANNEIGSVQDIQKISTIIRQHGGLLHVDGVQAFGQIPIDVDEMGVDMLSVSGHKVGCPKGIGFLYIRNGTTISPLIYGSQMDGKRGGTENAPYIMGMAKAVELCDVSENKIIEMQSKRDYFIGCLEMECGCKLNGHYPHRLPNNISVTFPQNITGEALLYTLDMSDIQISTGSACNSKSIEPSYVLKAIGLTDEEAMRTIRISLSDDITYSDIDYVVEEIDKAIKLIET